MSEEKKLKIEKVDIAEGGRYGKFVLFKPAAEIA